MDNEFNIGDIVQITDDGCSYTTYSTMAEIMGLTKYVYGNKYKHHPPTYSDLKVITISEHGDKNSVTLYGVECVSTGYQYIISNEYGNMMLVKPAAQYTPWTVYNNTLQVSDLTDEQAVELFVAWRKGGIMQYCVEDEWYDTTMPTWLNMNVYRIKSKSELDLFVEKAVDVAKDADADGFASLVMALYNAGCRFV